MEEAHQPETWTGYVDWRNRPALRGKHGGMVAASFVLVVEVLENMAFLANASNLVTYLAEFMHLSPSHSATAVTNFMGTAFLLAVLGGFLSDAFFTTYHIYLISALLEFLGLVILTVQAKTPALKPAACNTPTRCVAISGGKATLLFVGLYLTALGVGGIKGSLPAHGAEQFDADTAQGRKARSTFFNYFVFCLSCGGLVAVTLVVWIEDNLGWQWGFSISTIAILLSLPVFLAGSATYRTRYPPQAHSQVTTIGKVLVAAVFNSCCTQKPKNAVVDMVPSPVMIDDLKAQRPENTAKEEKDLISAAPPNAELKFLNKATQGKSALSAVTCTAEEVEDVKIVFKLLPIFLSTIMLSCCLAQLSTFSVHQAATMDTRIGSLIVPPASLPLFPILFILFLAPIYDHVILPLARRLTKNEAGITNLQRIGFGLLMSAVAMAAAAAVETKRKRTASRDLPTGGASAPLPISFLWLVFQYLFLGSADLFTLAGMLEFFFEEAPGAMRSLATALSWASLAMGYYLSSVLVAVVNRVTGRGGRPAWLEGRSLDAYYLERFYWLMCALSAINFLHYLFWASRYRYRSRNF